MRLINLIPRWMVRLAPNSSRWEDPALMALLCLGIVFLVAQLTYPFVQRGLLFTLTWACFAITWVLRKPLGRWVWAPLVVLLAFWFAMDLLTVVGDTFLREDFEVNDVAARQLYGLGRSPYGFEAQLGLLNYSISVPFPTYWIYWLCSGFGALPPTPTFAVFRIVMVGLYGLGWVILWRWFAPQLPSDPYPRWWFLSGIGLLAMAGWGWPVIGMGQTSIVVWVGLMVWLCSTQAVRPWVIMLAAGGPALALLTKPMLAVIWFAGPAAWRQQTGRIQQWGRTMTWALPGWILGVILGTLLIPGGVTWRTYQTWWTQVLPHAEAYTVGSSTNFSPAVWLADTKLELVKDYPVPAGVPWVEYARTLRGQGVYQVLADSTGDLVPTFLGGTAGERGRLGLGRIVADPTRWWGKPLWGVWILVVLLLSWWARLTPVGWVVAAVLCSPLVWCHYLVWLLPAQVGLWRAELFSPDSGGVGRFSLSMAVLNSWVPVLSQVGLLWMAYHCLLQSRKECVTCNVSGS